MTDRELFRQALEALELLAWYENPSTKVQVRKPRNGGPIVTMYPHKVATEAAAPLRERLAQPVAHSLMCVCGAVWDIKDDGSEEMVHTPDAPPARKPVAWRWKERINNDFDSWVVTSSEPPPYAIEEQPLYTAPQRREWVGLTEEEIKALPQWFPSHETAAVMPLIRAIEAKLKEKNA